MDFQEKLQGIKDEMVENQKKNENNSGENWYLTHFSRITIADLKEVLEKENIEYFLPTMPAPDLRRKAQHTTIEKSAMFNMLFIHGKLNKMANFVYAQPKICFMFNKKREYVTPLYKMADTIAIKRKMDEEAKKRKEGLEEHFDMLCDESTFKDVVVIPNDQMEMFKRAMIYCDTESMPYVRPSDIDFDKGDKVRVIGGKLHGVEGYLVSQQGRDGGHIIVKLCNDYAIKTISVEPEYIQILEFAKTGKHIYKKFDSFMTRGERCIKNLIDGKDQDIKDIGYLLNFTRRFEKLQTLTTNMKAKHLLYMFIASACLGDKEHSEEYEKKLSEFLPNINSEIMKANCLLNLFKCTRRETYRQQLKTMVVDWGKIEPDGKGNNKLIKIREDFKEYNMLL